jgi:tyrosine-protein kinase Etk/Wzc
VLPCGSSDKVVPFRNTTSHSYRDYLPFMPDKSQNDELTPNAVDDDEVGIMDFLIVLAKHKALTLVLPFIVAVIAAGYSLRLPNTFTANTKLLPPQSQSVSLAQQIGGLAGLAGLIGGSPGKGTGDLYVAMLKSRAVADNLIQRFGLMKQWEINAEHPGDAYGKLEGVTTILTGKDGTISIEVSDVDPKQAADIANAYVDELLKLTSIIAVTEASKRRLFFERQLAQAKENLSKAENAARQGLQGGGGLVKVDEQGRAMVEVTARLRGQITVKQVQIGAMRAFAADRNPDLLAAQQELESLKNELAKAEGSAGGAKPEKANGQGIDNLGLLRDVKYFEVIYELLARQFEIAKIDEAKDGAIIQVLDKAIVPDRRSGPKRTYIVLMSAVLAGFFGLIIAFAIDSFGRSKQNPRQLSRLQTLKGYLKFR